MVTRHWLLYCTFLILTASTINDNAVAATVEPAITLTGSSEPVYLGDSVIIELEAVGMDDPVDISPLFKDADLLRETSGTRITVIDDKVVEMKSRRMEFIPRREGGVVFGPLRGSGINDQVTSNVLVIDVQPPAEYTWQPTQDDFQIRLALSFDKGNSTVTRLHSGSAASSDRVSISEAQPFIGQKIIADIELRHRFPIADEEISLPDFIDFDVLESYVERRTVLNQDNKDSWRITAWRYHLFARRSGELILGDVTWKGTAIRSRTQRAAIEKRSQFQTLLVKPAIGTARWWLAANEVDLSDSWSSDPRELSAGDEILRTITLTARDVLASHLPDIVPPESRALSTTPISQARSQKWVGDHVTATAVFEFRMVAQSPIPVFLDTVRVPWYSTADSSAKEAIIPARRINVGLPDRADLLASIALKDRWIDRIILRLEGSTDHWVLWYATLVLLLLTASWLWLQELRHCIHERRNFRQGIVSTTLPDL